MSNNHKIETFTPQPERPPFSEVEIQTLLRYESGLLIQYRILELERKILLVTKEIEELKKNKS